MTEPKITVIIPTRERLPVLRHCIRTVLAQEYRNLKILVSDNCSTDGTGAFVGSLLDQRICYVNTERRISMSENWEFALSQVDDGWVMFLGDDDGLLPGAIATLAQAIESTDCEAITFRACNFIWPDPDSSNLGRLIIPFSRGREVRRASHWLGRVITSKADYSNLPMIYVLGLVHVPLIRRIRQNNGRFFNSCIPDIYASIALARSISKYLYINEAHAIIGSSRFSNGGSFILKAGKVDKEAEYRRFASENTIPFHPDISPPPSGHPLSWQMCVYEGFLQSKFLQPEAQSPSVAKQLALALAHPYAPEQYDSLNQEWGREFARLHGLDFNEALASAKFLRRKAKVGSLLRRIRIASESLAISGSSVPLNDVYAASLVAGTALWARPSVVTRLRHAARYKLGRKHPSTLKL